jgi:hypothetical protein
VVIGLDPFREYFAGCEGQYVLIGGTACDIIFGEAGIEFRQTRDFDMVLCIEALDTQFAERFWAFIEAAGYQNRQRGDGEKQFYRFEKPKDPRFPSMIEVFARKPDAIPLAEGSHLTPVPLGGDLESLSAILLDDDYYELLRNSIRVLNGIAVAHERTLIPFKARAYLDMEERRAAGDETVGKAKVNRHRADVFRILALIAAGEVTTLPGSIATDVARFCETVEADNTFDPKANGFTTPKAELIARLRAAYGL